MLSEGEHAAEAKKGLYTSTYLWQRYVSLLRLLWLGLPGELCQSIQFYFYFFVKLSHLQFLVVPIK